MSPLGRRRAAPLTTPSVETTSGTQSHHHLPLSFSSTVCPASHTTLPTHPVDSIRSRLLLSDVMGDYIAEAQQRETDCATRARNALLTWAAGSAVVYGGVTYALHTFCQTLHQRALTHHCLHPPTRLTHQPTPLVLTAVPVCDAIAHGCRSPCHSAQLPLQGDPREQSVTS